MSCMGSKAKLRKRFQSGFNVTFQNGLIGMLEHFVIPARSSYLSGFSKSDQKYAVIDANIFAGLGFIFVGFFDANSKILW